MRFALNNEQWEKLGDNLENISEFPATVRNFLQYFTEINQHGNFNLAYNPEKKLFGVWFDDMLDKFEEEELIDALFNMFCYFEEI